QFGKFSAFENGNLYWSPLTGAHPVLDGPLMDAWADEDYEAGRYGFPTGSQREDDGRSEQDFQFGTIVVEADGRLRSARADVDDTGNGTDDGGGGGEGGGDDEDARGEGGDGDEPDAQADQTADDVEDSGEITEDDDEGDGSGEDDADTVEE